MTDSDRPFKIINNESAAGHMLGLRLVTPCARWEAPIILVGLRYQAFAPCWVALAFFGCIHIDQLPARVGLPRRNMYEHSR